MSVVMYHLLLLLVKVVSRPCLFVSLSGLLASRFQGREEVVSPELKQLNLVDGTNLIGSCTIWSFTKHIS